VLCPLFFHQGCSLQFFVDELGNADVLVCCIGVRSSPDEEKST
jgi:hypothetical protein